MSPTPRVIWPMVNGASRTLSSFPETTKTLIQKFTSSTPPNIRKWGVSVENKLMLIPAETPSQSKRYEYIAMTWRLSLIARRLCSFVVITVFPCCCNIYSELNISDTASKNERHLYQKNLSRVLCSHSLKPLTKSTLGEP